MGLLTSPRLQHISVDTRFKVLVSHMSEKRHITSVTARCMSQVCGSLIFLTVEVSVTANTNEDSNEFITVVFEHSIFFKENGFMLDKVTSNTVYNCRASLVTRTHLHTLRTELAVNQSFPKTCISSFLPHSCF